MFLDIQVLVLTQLDPLVPDLDMEKQARAFRFSSQAIFVVVILSSTCAVLVEGSINVLMACKLAQYHLCHLNASDLLFSDLQKHNKHDL